MARLWPLAERIFAVDNRHVEGKSGIVVGDSTTVVFDTGCDYDEGREIRELALSLSQSPIVVAYSHGHWDHALGGAAFPDAHVICHVDAVDLVEEQLAASEHGHPQQTFEDSLELELGGVTVSLRHAPGHTAGSAVLWASDAGVLFASDTVVTSIPPVFRDGDEQRLEATLASLRHLGADVLVPGHGDVVRGGGTIDDVLSATLDYLVTVRENVERSVDQGLSKREILDAIDDFDARVEAYPLDPERTIERHRNLYADMVVDVLRRRAGAPDEA